MPANRVCSRSRLIRNVVLLARFGLAAGFGLGFKPRRRWTESFARRLYPFGHASSASVRCSISSLAASIFISQTCRERYSVRAGDSGYALFNLIIARLVSAAEVSATQAVRAFAPARPEYLLGLCIALPGGQLSISAFTASAFLSSSALFLSNSPALSSKDFARESASFRSFSRSFAVSPRLSSSAFCPFSASASDKSTSWAALFSAWAVSRLNRACSSSRSQTVRRSRACFSALLGFQCGQIFKLPCARSNACRHWHCRQSWRRHIITWPSVTILKRFENFFAVLWRNRVFRNRRSAQQQGENPLNLRS